MLGAFSASTSSNGRNRIAIGYSAQSNADHKARLGNDSLTVLEFPHLFTVKSADVSLGSVAGPLTIHASDNSGAGDGGDLILRSGTSGSGDNGDIILDDNSTTTVGHVWTATGTSGEGEFQPAVSPLWKKYTLTDADLTDTDLHEAVIIDTGLIVFSVVESVIVKHSTQFSGTACSALTVEVGNSSIDDKYSTAFDIEQIVTATAFQQSTTVGFETVSTNLVAVFDSAGCNLDIFDAGSVDIWVKWTVLP